MQNILISKYKMPWLIYTPVLAVVMVIASCKKESVFQAPPKPQVTIDAKRAASGMIHLVKDTIYLLAVNLNRDSGQSLVMDAGVLLKVNGSLSITINQGAIIEVNGTAGDPVVLTSSANQGAQGQGPNGGNWSGIQVFGNNTGVSSGSITYMRLEFAGLYSPALMLNHLGKETILNHIEISYSYNNTSFEFNGGNCNSSELLSYASGGTDFVLDNGYTGVLQNLLAYRHPFYSADIQSLAGMCIKDPGTNPVVSNLTVLGPDTLHGLTAGYLRGSSQRAALLTINNSVFHIRNSVLFGFPVSTYAIDSYNTSDSLDKDVSELAHTIFYNSDTSKIFYLPDGTYPPYISTDLRNFLSKPEYQNQIYEDPARFMLSNAFNYYDGIPDPAPKSGSPLLTGADFSGTIFSDPFLKKVPYIGAIGNDNWLAGWSNFIPLQTEYNY